jgi:hypothetical protein
MDEVLPPAAAAGRARGQPNFTVAEDTMLCSAYVVVTTNAAIATDQNGSTFWDKVRLGFIQFGGSAGRTSGSLQNRFNKTIQLEVNKFIGMLANTLREHHSGWALEDYTHNAKRRFIAKFQKPFKHETCYGVLKALLTKFAIDMDAVHPRVQRALFFCNNDNAPAPDPNVNVDGGDVDCGDVGGVAADVGGVRPCPLRAFGEPYGVVPPGIRMYTPRPSVGKKKAKALLSNSSNASNKNKKQKIEAMSEIKKLLLSVAIPWPFLSRRQKEECPGRATLCLPIF